MWRSSLTDASVTKSRHRVSQMKITLNIMAVQEFDVVGVTELSPNQQGVLNLPSNHGTFSPQLQGENRDTEEGQSKKKERKEKKNPGFKVCTRGWVLLMPVLGYF